MDGRGIPIRLGGPAALVLLAYPVATLFAEGSPWWAASVAIGALSVFVALYLRVWFSLPPARPLPSAPLAIVVLTLIAMGFNVAFPAELLWGTLFVYAAIAAGCALPGLPGLASVGGVILLALPTLLAISSSLSPELRRGLPLVAAEALLQLLLAGLGAAGMRRLLETTDDLRAAREELARLAVERERQRFARDLHDLLGHSLSLIALKSELAGRLLPGSPERAAGEIRDIERAARDALGEVRAAVSGARLITLGGELVTARAMLAAAGIELRVERLADPPSRESDEVLGWAVREAATNVIRHSRARRCTVRIAREEGAILVEVDDDGLGGPPTRTEAGGSGSGLAGLAERAAALGGRLRAATRPGGGFRLALTLPVGTGSRVIGSDIVPVGDGER